VKLVLVAGTFSAEFQQGRESIGLTTLFLVVVKNVPDAIARLYNDPAVPVLCSSLTTTCALLRLRQCSAASHAQVLLFCASPSSSARKPTPFAAPCLLAAKQVPTFIGSKKVAPLFQNKPS
jgi:hypothetical protein